MQSLTFSGTVEVPWLKELSTQFHNVTGEPIPSTLYELKQCSPAIREKPLMEFSANAQYLAVYEPHYSSSLCVLNLTSQPVLDTVVVLSDESCITGKQVRRYVIDCWTFDKRNFLATQKYYSSLQVLFLCVLHYFCSSIFRIRSDKFCRDFMASTQDMFGSISYGQPSGSVDPATNHHCHQQRWVLVAIYSRGLLCYSCWY